jgi:hypothetical protein
VAGATKASLHLARVEAGATSAEDVVVVGVGVALGQGVMRAIGAGGQAEQQVSQQTTECVCVDKDRSSGVVRSTEEVELDSISSALQTLLLPTLVRLNFYP